MPKPEDYLKTTDIVSEAQEALNPPSSQEFPEEPDELIGTQLGHYLIRMQIGRGAVGRVYLADDLTLGRQCALKVLSPKVKDQVSYQVYLRDFQNEARMVAKVRDPHIVTIHKQDEDRGYHFLDMEYFPEGSLQRVLDHQGKMEPIHATRIAHQIAKGLSAAHLNEVIHRDLKPGNVLISNDGIAKIGDFGLARPNVNLDGTGGVLMGTIAYMAPEIFDYCPANQSTDVYALGVTYFQMLTGELPFLRGTPVETIKLIHGNRVPNVLEFNPRIPLEMAECLYQMLAPDGSRPKNAIEAAANLAALLGRIRDIDSLLTEAFGRDDPNVQWSGSNGRYTVRLQLAGGRKQDVYVENSDHVRSSEQLLLIYSTCGKVPESTNEHLYHYALKLNSSLSHGAMAIRHVAGKDHFVMVDSYPRATVDVEEIRRSVLEAGVQADHMEQILNKYIDEH